MLTNVVDLREEEREGRRCREEREGRRWRKEGEGKEGREGRERRQREGDKVEDYSVVLQD